MKTFFVKTWRGLLAALAGVLLSLCFIPFNLPDLVWVVPVLWFATFWRKGEAKKKEQRIAFSKNGRNTLSSFFRAARESGRLSVFLLGWLSGMVFWSINLKWLSVVTGPGYLVLAAYLALYFAVFALFTSTVGNPWRGSPKENTGLLEVTLRSLAFAALNGGAWCGLEWIRGWMLTGFGWNGLGVPFGQRLALAQCAEWVGVTGLAFLPIFLGAVLVQAGARMHESVAAGKMKRQWDFLAAISIIFTVFIVGTLRMAEIKGRPGEESTVLVVQMNMPQVASEVLMSGDDVHAAYLSETRKAFEELDKENEQLIAEAEGEVKLKRIDWIVWPEVVLSRPLLIVEDGGYRMYEGSSNVIREVSGYNSSLFIVGMTEAEARRTEDGNFHLKDGGQSYNSLVAIDRENAIETYRKSHLVIYGEFIPFFDTLPWLGKFYELAAGVKWAGNLGRGEREEPILVPGPGGEVSIIPSVCFEDTVPRVPRKMSRGPREVLVNITNDGWFGTSEGSRQHFENARFRTIELRCPMVRAANQGVTGLITDTGSLWRPGAAKGEAVEQVLKDENGLPFTSGHVRGTVKISTEGGPTLYARIGDSFSVAGLVVALGFGFWRRTRFSK